MSYNVNVPKTDSLDHVAILEWVEKQGWQHMQEWRWFYPHIGQRDYFIFQFEQEKHAAWFKLRWLS